MKNCLKIAKLLTEPSENVLSVWTGQTEAALQELNKTVTTPPALRQLDITLPIHITADPSKYAIGGAMEQYFRDGCRPVLLCIKSMESK